MSRRFYGSISNRLKAMAPKVMPEVGMGVTELMWSDRNPYEVIEVKDSTHIIIRELSAERTDHNGMSEIQEYRFSSNLRGAKKPLVFRNGRWRECQWDITYAMDADGRPKKDENGNLIEVSRKPSRRLESSEWYVGQAEKYWDPCF